MIKFMGVLFIGLASGAIALGQIVNSEAELIVPPASVGRAEIPLLNEYKSTGNSDLLVAQKKAKCFVQYDDQGIVFNFTVALRPGFVPAGPTQRDTSPIYADSGLRVEILLIPRADRIRYHYIINSAGGIYDEKNTESRWNGHPDFKTQVSKDRWTFRVKIPFSDLEVTGQTGKDPADIKALVVVNSNDPRDAYSYTWTAVGTNFMNTDAYGTLKFSRDLPFATRMNISPIKYGEQGAAIDIDYMVKNPSKLSITAQTPAQKISIPAGGAKSFAENITLPATRNGIVNFKVNGILNYRHQVVNNLIPNVQMVALDLKTFTVKVWNLAFLARFADKVRILIDDKSFLDSPLAEVEKHKIDIARLPYGDHVFKFVLLNGRGHQVAQYVQKFQTIEAKKYDYDITRLDASKYYKPITLVADQLKVAQSSFDLSDGPLPKKVSVAGRNILAAPITIRFNGQDLVQGKQKQILDPNKNCFQLVSQGTTGDKNLTIKAQHEYDGFTWYEVSLKSQDKKAFGYGPLDIVIPLDLGPDILIGQTNPIGDRRFVNDTLTGIGFVKEIVGNWDKMTADVLDLPMINCISLATDTDEHYRGLCFVTEGPVGWNLKNYDKMYRIKKEGNGKVTLTVHVSDGVTQWKRDEIKFSFGLEPFPMRVFPNNFKSYYRLDGSFDPRTFTAFYEDAKKKGHIYFFDDLAQTGGNTEVAFEHWTDRENYWKAGPLREQDILNYTKAAHEARMKVIFYFSCLISNKVPEYPLYHELILDKSNPKPQDPDEQGFQPYLFYQFGDPDQNAYGYCSKSLWPDRLLAGMEEAISHYHMDGIYLDGMFGSHYCLNTKHGCGTRDPYGRLIVTYPVRANRRMEEILYTIGQKHNPNFIIDTHMNEIHPPFAGLISGFYTGESTSFFDEKYCRMTPDQIRGWINGRMFGIGGDLLLRPPYYHNIAWGQVLLVDTFVRQVFGAGPVKFGDQQLMWGLYERYGMTNDTFTPFFSTRNKVKKDNSKIYISYYDTPKAWILVVSNYMQETDQPVNLDLAALTGVKTRSAVDAWNIPYVPTAKDLNDFLSRGKPMPIQDGKISLTIPALSFRLLVIEK